MKITEYPSAQFLDEGDVLIKDGTNGTKQIKGSDLVYALFDGIPEMHSQIFRGKNLGSTFTSAQQNAISDGTFHDLWLGDYWESGSVKYRIVDFDYYYKHSQIESDESATHHHVVVMPDEPLSASTTPLNNSATSFAYSNCSARTGSVMSSVRSTVQSFFGSDHILSYNDNCIFSKVNVGTGYGSVHTDRSNLSMTIEIPEVYHILGAVGNMAPSGTRQPAQAFNLFVLCPKFIKCSIPDQYYLTRSLSGYASSNNNYRGIRVAGDQSGEISNPTTADLNYIRPYFCLKG